VRYLSERIYAMEHGVSNLPPKFLERIEQLVPPNRKKEVLNAFCTQRTLSIRANTLKISADELERILVELGLSFERVLWNKKAFLLLNDSQKSLEILMKTDFYKNGYFYIQSLSSMIPALILAPQPNEKILDIAAAPGSKTTQIAALMQNTGEIVANDISKSRIYKLKANLKHQQVTNTKVICMPGQILWQKYPEYFDRSLVDAPCSLEGRINCYDPKTYKDWSTKRIKILSQRERFLLRSAVSATKPGGIIVYSTCTLAPEENEEVIDWLLQKEKSNLDLEPIELPGLKTDPAILHWGKHVYNSKIKNAIRVLPSTTMEAFFIVKIRKLRSNLINHS
jgi:16S rRNA (cytosine1407-C5)-methyltransferase